MRQVLPTFLAFLALLGAACTSIKYICPPEGEEIPLSTEGSNPSNNLFEIRGRLVSMDKVVHGSFCDDTWSGTVYVACDVQVAEWSETPSFLDGCSLSIQEGTVVYVADHNNEAYYQGCSCHYSEARSTTLNSIR